MTMHRVAGENDVEAGCLLRVEAHGAAICLAKLEDGSFRALPDECTHEQVSLSDGDLDENDIECPAHGSRFDVDTGEVSGLPAIIPTKTIPVTVEDGQVYVDV